MSSVADSVGIRSHGIAGATLATLDLARARMILPGRLGLPPSVDKADKFAFLRGASVVTVRLASGAEGSTLARPATTMKLAVGDTGRSPRRCITSRSRASPRSQASAPRGLHNDLAPADDPRRRTSCLCRLRTQPN
jgi:hypothetical protein